MRGKREYEPERRVYAYRIDAKPAEYIFCPANAIENEFYHRDPYIIPALVTSEGNTHKARFIGTWNNSGGVYEEEFESICRKYYGMSFVSIRSLWIGRLGKLDNYWHLIKLDEDDSK